MCDDPAVVSNPGFGSGPCEAGRVRVPSPAYSRAVTKREIWRRAGSERSSKKIAVS
jgi:hypothetical protein